MYEQIETWRNDIFFSDMVDRAISADGKQSVSAFLILLMIISKINHEPHYQLFKESHKMHLAVMIRICWNQTFQKVKGQSKWFLFSGFF